MTEVICAERPVGRIASSDLAYGFSIEVLPRTAARITDFREVLPPHTRVYIAHVDGTPVDDMVSTARLLVSQGYTVMPHIKARSLRDEDDFRRLVHRYRDEAGVRQALVLAGGMNKPIGQFHSSIQLLRTHHFDRAGFTDVHLAGHPEGSKDIDPKGGTENVDAAVKEKWDFSKHSDVKMALVTQFVFSAEPVIVWTKRLEKQSIGFPVHVGVSGPARLQTLLKYAVLCGIGPSVKILQRRTKDFRRLLLPIDATDIVKTLAHYKSEHPNSIIEGIHVFPLGGILEGAEWGIKLGVKNETGCRGGN